MTTTARDAAAHRALARQIETPAAGGADAALCAGLQETMRWSLGPGVHRILAVDGETR